MSLRQKVIRSDHVNRSGDERNVVRGHALFVRFMERKGLGDCIHYFPDTMTLGNLRSATQLELMTKHNIRYANDRERIMRIVDESHREDQSDVESDYSSSPKQSSSITVPASVLDDSLNRRSASGVGAHLLHRTLSETVKNRRPDKISTPNIGKHLSCSQYGLNLSWNSGAVSSGGHESSNLVRLRNSSLGKSAPLLSTCPKDIGFGGCCSTPTSRRPSGRISTAASRRSLILPSSTVASPVGVGGISLSLTLQPTSAASAAAGGHSPGLLLGSPLDSPRSASSACHSQFQFVSNKSMLESRRWSVASVASSGCPSNVSSQYSSQERLHYGAAPLTPDGSSSPSTVIPFSHSLPKPQRRRHQHQHFDSNDSNTPLAVGDGDVTGADGHVSSGSNSSGLRSPLLRPRSQSLSSPARSPGVDSGTMLMNNVYRERFPKAVVQMEECLTQFIEANQLDEVDACLDLDGTARFVQRQVVELARDCLEKSRSKLISSSYFYELSENLERLRHDAEERSAAALEHITQLMRTLLMIVSRPARLLECLEFDPEEFYRLLEAAEGQAKQTIKTDIPRYIVSKLGLVRDNLIGTDVSSIDSGRPDTPETDDSSENHFTSSSTSQTVEKQAKTRLFMQKKQPGEDDFETIKLVSNGAYGAVYLVRHKDTKQIFAMKKLLKSNLVLRNQVVQVFAERDILTFTDNPFVVSFYCSFETKKHLCMVLEYVEGGDCGTLLKNIGGPLSFDLARMYFAETVLALEYLHNYGIVHRDLKPDNLLITLMGHIKLTDFGLSKMGLMNLTTNLYEGAIDKDCTQFKDLQIFGTPEYIAPEVILRQGYGKPVDWWSMGIILYEFLVGCVPFYGSTPEDLFSQIIHDEVEWPDEADYCPPDDAKDLILSLLQRNPLKRLGTGGVHEVKEHLFFEGFDWEGLLRQKAEFVPHLQNEEDTSYFDTRCDRYNHEAEDDTEDDSEDVMFYSFSSCSPRYIKFEELREKRLAGSDTSEGNSSTSSKIESVVEPEPVAGVSLQEPGQGLSPSVIHSSSQNTDGDSDASSKSHGHELDSAKTVKAETNTNWKALHEDQSDEIFLPNEVVSTVKVIDVPDGVLNVSTGQKTTQSTSVTSQVSSENRLTTEFQPIFRRKKNGEKTKADHSEPLLKIQTRAQQLKYDATIAIPKFSISLDESSFKDSILVDEKDKEDADKLGPLRPMLVPSKSAPSMPAAARDLKDRSSGVVTLRCLSDFSSKLMPKSASASLISQSVPSPPAVVEAATSEPEPLQSSLSIRPSVPSPSSAGSSRDGSPPPFDRPFGGATSAVGAASGSTLLKPSVIIRRGPRGYGFTLRAIRVYYGDSEYYTLHHLVVAVERNSPAMDAGLSAGDLITHVNGTSVQGLLHIELVRLILTGGSSVTLCTVPLASTSIRIGSRKVAGGVGGAGYVGLSQACTLPSRHRRRPNDDRRRRSSLFRQLSNRKAAEQQLTATSSPLSPHRLSLSSNDSIPNSPTALLPTMRLQSNTAAAVESWMIDSAHSTGNSSSQSSSPGSSAPGSPAVACSPSSMAAVGGRPSSLHGLKHKLAVSRANAASRRKSWHNNPLSPLVRTPSPSPGTATSPSRSPSPLTTVAAVHHRIAPLTATHVPGISNMAQLYNPAQPQSGIGLTGSNQVRLSAAVTCESKLVTHRNQSPERRAAMQNQVNSEVHRRSMTGPLERTMGLLTTGVDIYSESNKETHDDQMPRLSLVLPTANPGTSAEDSRFRYFSDSDAAVSNVQYASGFGSVKLQTGLKRSEKLRIDVGQGNMPIAAPLNLSPLVAVDIQSNTRQQDKVDALRIADGELANENILSSRGNPSHTRNRAGCAFVAEVKSNTVQIEQKSSVSCPQVAIKTGTRSESEDEYTGKGRKSH